MALDFDHGYTLPRPWPSGGEGGKGGGVVEKCVLASKTPNSNSLMLADPVHRSIHIPLFSSFLFFFCPFLAREYWESGTWVIGFFTIAGSALPCVSS